MCPFAYARPHVRLGVEMIWNGMATKLAALSLLYFAAACQTTPAGPVMTARQFLDQYPVQAALLAPGDKLRLSLYGDDALSGDYEVAQDGTISLPLVGAVKAAGLDVEAFRTAVEQQLSQGFYNGPRISAQLLNLQPVYVLGEVNKAGAFPYVPDLTLSKAAALAGGYTFRARMDVVAIRRARADTERTVQADQSLQLAPGDTVRVLERHF